MGSGTDKRDLAQCVVLGLRHGHVGVENDVLDTRQRCASQVDRTVGRQRVHTATQIDGIGDHPLRRHDTDRHIGLSVDVDPVFDRSVDAGQVVTQQNHIILTTASRHVVYAAAQGDTEVGLVGQGLGLNRQAGRRPGHVQVIEGVDRENFHVCTAGGLRGHCRTRNGRLVAIHHGINNAVIELQRADLSDRQIVDERQGADVLDIRQVALSHHGSVANFDDVSVTPIGNHPVTHDGSAIQRGNTAVVGDVVNRTAVDDRIAIDVGIGHDDAVSGTTWTFVALEGPLAAGIESAGIECDPTGGQVGIVGNPDDRTIRIGHWYGHCSLSKGAAGVVEQVIVGNDGQRTVAILVGGQQVVGQGQVVAVDRTSSVVGRCTVTHQTDGFETGDVGPLGSAQGDGGILTINSQSVITRTAGNRIGNRQACTSVGDRPGRHVIEDHGVVARTHGDVLRTDHREGIGADPHDDVAHFGSSVDRGRHQLDLTSGQGVVGDARHRGAGVGAVQVGCTVGRILVDAAVGASSGGIQVQEGARQAARQDDFASVLSDAGQGNGVGLGIAIHESDVLNRTGRARGVLGAQGQVEARIDVQTFCNGQGYEISGAGCRLQGGVDGVLRNAVGAGVAVLGVQRSRFDRGEVVQVGDQGSGERSVIG
ncbi:MAG: hypothetical protein AW09_001471 [Candidatus Accumulibacter phosphatis]|uniref:Uncharacterized protein n=1 Tax=Candidatus Accumulibacter phosphatis TaxID=327160 RepID=A0A080LX33_9PROT|nr:MAG: hypothetical protein AW09_001471 [Candidatus Accumulibacter phosphatis]